VDRILLQDGYYGVLGHYAVDIAVVVLENSVSFSNGITPVCMDWNGIYTVSNGNEGKVGLYFYLNFELTTVNYVPIIIDVCPFVCIQIP